MNKWLHNRKDRDNKLAVWDQIKKWQVKLFTVINGQEQYLAEPSNYISIKIDYIGLDVFINGFSMFDEKGQEVWRQNVNLLARSTDTLTLNFGKMTFGGYTFEDIFKTVHSSAESVSA